MAHTRKHTKRSRKGRSKTRRASLRHRRRRTHKRHMKGGNYEKDITTRSFGGIPTKPLNKFVISAPGVGVMSGTSYARLMEDRDRNGNDIYD